MIRAPAWLLMLAACGDHFFAQPPPEPAPAPTVPFERVAVIGASVSAGMNGGPVAQIIEGRIEGPHEILSVASVWTFQAPVQRLAEQVARARAFKPTAVLAIDAVFWCAYGSRRDRSGRLRRCLDLVAPIEAPLFLGDLPDMRNAAGWLLPPAAIPDAAELAALNAIITEWAAQRANVRVLPLSEWNKPILSGDRELRKMMSADGLHPNRDGVAYVLRKIAREVDGGGALGRI